jgi:SCF-associated factor 1
MADKVANITELPLDILVLVFPYLDAKSFLSFCSTCKAFQQPSIRLDPAYWSYATRSAFRVPNQPIVQHDGVRWETTPIAASAIHTAMTNSRCGRPECLA